MHGPNLIYFTTIIENILSCRCFLRADTHFIWAFIGPVILIFVINIFFTIIAASIMWKKRSISKNKNYAMNWLKSVISLMIVMGLTWIVGVIVVERKELLPLAYIYTIAAALQGLFLFLILIAFQKSVRDELVNWTRAKLHMLSHDNNKPLSLQQVRKINKHAV